jgi:hypothetical protein
VSLRANAALAGSVWQSNEKRGDCFDFEKRVVMLATIILIVLAVVLIALFVKVVQGGFGNGGGSTNVIAGATQDLMTRDQRKAVEVIVKQQAGEKEEEQTYGEPENREKIDKRSRR